MKLLGLMHYVKEFGFSHENSALSLDILCREVTLLDPVLEPSLLAMQGMYWKGHSEK